MSTKSHKRVRGTVAAALPMSVMASMVAVNTAAPEAHAGVIFNRQGAINTSNQFWNSDPGRPRQPFGSDCTNFSSYSWELGGGVAQNNAWFIRNNPTAVLSDFRDWSLTWSAVENFEIYHRTQHWTNGSLFSSRRATTVSNQIAGSVGGDLILYNWNDGGSQTDHLAMDMGGVTFPDGYVDTHDGNRKYILGGVFTGINQHTANRHGAPWNFGYLQKKYRDGDAATADGMLFKVVHVNT